MVTVEFETEITSRFLELKDYDKLVNKHARVIIQVDDEQEDTHQLREDVALFEQLQSRRSQKREVPQDVAIESMEDDINDDVF
ncbi:hypothetical protein ACFOZ5_14445 [Marinobacter lacisalsi]|uniref:Uncharacterized protein n=1 Tax=Marinobacter lacisalsi TaxID=475979 RepID=A0ABV8QMV9_9GAMM